MDAKVRNRTFDSFERTVELPMLILAVLMVPVLIAPEIWDLSSSLTETLFVLDWFIWAVFALELVIKTYLAVDRVEYVRRHWYDVIIVALPMLRPLRVVRSLRLLRAARGARLLSFAARFLNSSRRLLDTHGIKYALLAASILFVASAGLALEFEKGAGGNINSLGDAIWWAASTITTVGYGDRYPVTTEGRAIAIFLMFLGISLFSLITASVAALFVLPEQEKEEATLEDVMARLDALERLIVGLVPNATISADAAAALEMTELREDIALLARQVED
jgi:voltage-gated potassium channel